MPTQGPEPGNDTLFEASYRLGMLSDAPNRSIQNEHRLDLTTFLICSDFGSRTPTGESEGEAASLL